MAQRFSVLGLWAAMAAVALAAAPRCAAQTTTSGCTASIVSLSPCLSFTSGGSTSSAAAPSASCCSALESVVRGAPRCLCAVLGGGAAAALGVTVNTTRALELPGRCRIQTPPVSQCSAVGAPAASPATPTVEAPTAAPPVAAGAGSKVTPATGAPASSNAGVGTKAATVSVSFVVAVVASMMAF
ncbi:hypothetical protein ACP70R_015351 [Stipagrostis hirtigluma subsp. patula]